MKKKKKSFEALDREFVGICSMIGSPLHIMQPTEGFIDNWLNLWHNVSW